MTAVVAVDNDKRFAISNQGPYTRGVSPITPSDTDDLAEVCNAVVIGTAGDLVVTLIGMTDGVSITLTLPVGIHKLRAKRIWSTSTTAAKIGVLN